MDRQYTQNNRSSGGAKKEFTPYDMLDDRMTNNRPVRVDRSNDGLNAVNYQTNHKKQYGASYNNPQTSNAFLDKI
jgi:hypothetical protein